jgi:hypothetical protein
LQYNLAKCLRLEISIFANLNGKVASITRNSEYIKDMVSYAVNLGSAEGEISIIGSSIGEESKKNMVT